MKIVTGAFCTWWDSIDKVANREGLPVCPYCGGVLFEFPSEENWFSGVDKYEADNHPGYRKLIEWARGKCFPTFTAARKAYEKEQS